MATVEQCYAGVLGRIQAAMSNVGLNPVLGADWPTINTLQAVSTGASGPVVSLFDRGGTKNETRNVFLNPALPLNYGIAGGTLTTTTVEFGDSNTLTLVGGGIPLVNDAFFLVLATVGSNTIAEYITQQGDNLTASLAGLTAAINATTGLSASLSGNNIVVTNTAFGLVPTRCGVVNIGSFTQEIYRQCRELQITLWTNNPVDRQNFGVVLENLFANLEVNFGLELADQSWARILIVDDIVQKDSQLQDIYRRDFIISAEYPVLASIPAWAVESIDDYINGIL